MPPRTEALLLLIEDPDSPTPKPLVHAIAGNLVPRDGTLKARSDPGVLVGTYERA